LNDTEYKAKRWLIEQGKEVIFQPRKSPDFICGDGSGYEVKLLRNNSITFSTRQFDILSQYQNPLVVLVFDEGKEPLFIIPFNDLAARPTYWKHIRIVIYNVGNKGSFLLRTDDELKGTLSKKATALGLSLTAYIRMVLIEHLKAIK